MNDVAILLATYNGSRHLDEQLQSILNQSYSGFKLYARDDASSDGTASIVNRYMTDKRVSAVPTTENLGVVENFGILLGKATLSGSNYIFLSDQDDEWFEDKVKIQLELMQAMERKHGKETPLLIHSDLEVVDHNLDFLHESFMKYQGISNEKCMPLSVLVAQNFVTGCTVLINRPLLEIALPIPKEALMHDWWLALCAASLGDIGYIEQPLVKYRQHSSNEVGAKSIFGYLNPLKTNWIEHWLKGRANLLQSMEQARVLAERIKEHDPENKNIELIESYASLPLLAPWQRIRKLSVCNIHSQSLFRHLMMLSRVISFSRRKDG